MSVTRRSLLRAWLPDLDEPPPSLPAVLRPPGALPEVAFVRACDGCGECQRACPHDAIIGLPAEYGPAADTPAIEAVADPCRVCPDMPCAAACPTPALTPRPWSQVAMGTITARADRCWATRGQPCDYCVTACPLEGSAIAISDAGPAIDHARCVGCGACVYYCTAVPRALQVADRPIR